MKGPYVAGEHYILLDIAVATRDSSKVEVIEMAARIVMNSSRW